MHGIFVIAFLVAIDQLSKAAAAYHLQPISNVTVLAGFLDFTFVRNKGAAFGILQGARWFFVALTIVILCFGCYYYIKLPRAKPYGFVRLSLMLIGAGAIGNFIDRLFRGYVIDFFHVRFIEFPVFNFADIYIVIGTFLLAFLILFCIKDDEKADI